MHTSKSDFDTARSSSRRSSVHSVGTDVETKESLIVQVDGGMSALYQMSQMLFGVLC